MASILRSTRASSSAGVSRSARSASLRFTSSEPTPSSSSSDPSSTESDLSSSSPPPPSKPISVQHLLHRRPYLTPTPPPVLSAIQAYNQRLSLALSSPVPTHIYFKPGTLPARRFTYEAALLENEVFGTPMPEGMEVIEKDQAVLEIRERDALEKDEVAEGGALEGVQREDRKSCNREGAKSLYLLLKNKEGRWRFPGGDGRQEVQGREEGRPEYLHETTAHITHSLLGPHLSLWPVTRMPIAHVPGASSDEPSTFIFKSHALAGQPVLTEAATAAGIEDYAWLTKKEIFALVHEKGNEEDQRWWRVVRDILNDEH
ncbi:hypothetical protein BDY24DRAFT_396205 [Mrakia frigida]|uniref:mitochondrial 54S ribosomal protein mL46 MRPL17 n=1 Tax=Mrakia frigida TaxID=29902 RepID=UPI003FCBEFD4